MPKPIQVSSPKSGGSTVIPNIFFDKYMPEANGEFLKIYLYLLRWLPDENHAFSLSAIADTFLITETDVMRAMKYWEKKELLKLGYDSDNDLCSIQLIEPVEDVADEKPAHIHQPSASLHKESYTILSSLPDTLTNSGPEIRQATVSELVSFRESPEGDQLIFIIQRYLEHLLTPIELNTIYYFYDELGFSIDLIEYLFEYCVSNKHTNINYIQKVALNWHSEHIMTVDEARTQVESRQRSCYAVSNAFGISGRRLSSCEVDYINKWIKTYGFTLELVLEACRRTIMSTHNASFEYADRILTSWKNKNLYTMTEILAADKAHVAERTEKVAASSSSTTTLRKPIPSNRFHNFKQRSYDYDALEKKLTQKIQSVSND